MHFHLRQRHWCRDKMGGILQAMSPLCIFWNPTCFIFIHIWLKYVPNGAISMLRPIQNVHHFLENISLNFVPKDPINNIPALVQIMAWHEPGNKSLSKPMMTTLLTHICLNLSQWVNKMTSLFQKMRCCWTCKQAFIWTIVGLFSSNLYESCSLCEFTHCGRQQGWNLQSTHWFLGNPDTMWKCNCSYCFTNFSLSNFLW